VNGTNHPPAPDTPPQATTPAPEPAPAQAAEPAPAPAAAPAPAQALVWPPPPFDLNPLLLPADWTQEQLEAEAHRVYFEDLVPHPPQTPAFHWLEPLPLTIANAENGFKKVFHETTGWAQYHHNPTGRLDKERLRRVRWIRPILEMRVPKTKIYVNNHSMKPRQYGPRAEVERKRVFVTTAPGILFLISLVYTQPAPGLALATAYPPNPKDLREMEKRHGTMFLGPWPP
jgi:hypothetical protein